MPIGLHRKKKPSTGKVKFNKRVFKSNTNSHDTKNTQYHSALSRLQNIGLSIVASISKTRSKYSNKSSQSKYSNKEQQQQQQSRNLSVLNVDHNNNNKFHSTKKPSLSTRPFSQFIFPLEEQEEDDLFVVEQTSTERQSIAQKQIRHSIAVDYSSLQHDQQSTSSSSGSSSLKTIRNSEPDIDEKKYITLSRSFSQNGRLSSVVSVARARSVLGLDSWKSKENQAIHVWKNTISQLIISTKEEEEYNNTTNKDLYQILTHPALIPEYQLERQRFVRQPNHSMIKFILNELSETEKSYNQLLRLIKDRYMEPMIAASHTKDSLVKSTDIPILFNHLVDLVDLSDRLLNQFESSNNIGLIFRSFESDLVVFIKYAIHYKTNIKTIKRACNNVLFIKIDQENLSRRDTNRLGMSDYFIAPIQRIPRYCLLIKDLLKYIQPPDETDLNLALKILTGLAVAMDSLQSKTPLQTSLQTIKTL